MEIDADLFSCYYCSGNYDADLFSGASGFAMKGFQKLMENPSLKTTNSLLPSRLDQVQADMFAMFGTLTISTS